MTEQEYIQLTLSEMISVLGAICRIEADSDAWSASTDTFRVILTFSRKALRGTQWGAAPPEPTALFAQVYAQLTQWRTQRAREAQWVSKDAQMGSSIEGLMMHYTEVLKEARAKVPQNVATRIQAQVAADTVLRLQELKERREAGGVYSHAETSREKARKAWMEDEYEAPKREEEQARAREYWSFNYGADWSYRHGKHDYRKAFEDLYKQHKANQERQRQPPPRPNAANGKAWFEVLGVAASANEKEIKKAHRRLAAKYHPDRYKEPDGHERMVEINTARDAGLGGL